MPEGDTIFRAARALQKAMGGKVITAFRSEFPKVNRIDEDEPFKGREMTLVQARGKHLLMHLSGGLILRTHMRMAGSWHIYRHGEKWQRSQFRERICIENADFLAVAFDVNEAELIKEEVIERSIVSKLGPDLLGEAFDEAEVLGLMRKQPDAPICDVVLDQRVMAGAGNVYKSELLFLAKVHPLTAVRDIIDAKLQEIIASSREHLVNNVTHASGARITTGRADPNARTWVYGRAAEPCRECGAPIASASVGRHVRRTYWCPRCQKRS